MRLMPDPLILVTGHWSLVTRLVTRYSLLATRYSSMADLSRPQSIPATPPLIAPRSSLLARAWAARGVWLGAGAAGGAAWALTGLGDPAQRTAALWVLILAGALAVIAWGGVRPIPGVTAGWTIPQ